MPKFIQSLNKYLPGIVRGELEGGRQEVVARGRGQTGLNSCGMRGEREGGAGGLHDLSRGVAAPPGPPTPLTASVSFHRLGPGGVLHGHLPLPHAGGPVDSRGDAARGSPRNSVLPVPKPHASLGPPGKKPPTTRAAPVFCMGISAPLPASASAGSCVCSPASFTAAREPRGCPSGAKGPKSPSPGSALPHLPPPLGTSFHTGQPLSPDPLPALCFPLSAHTAHPWPCPRPRLEPAGWC